MKDFVEEMKWRGMIHDIMPGTKEMLTKEVTSGYIGFDPTADSLHVGNLVQVMTLVHFQRSGHKPVALVGGATGRIGDPSGRSAERTLLDHDSIEKNLLSIKMQLEKFLNFSGKNAAVVLNNYDWFKNFHLLDFIRDVGKHISVNYMLAKDSVKSRLETGLSFTEFTYQLIQGYDFYHLWKKKNVKIQFGGSDQWGNIVTGTELIRRKEGGEVFAMTTPLITKADGSKFGKSMGGNIWMDAQKTSPYKFYQYWINASDEDILKFIKIFSLKNRNKIEELIVEHSKSPHLRILQKNLADEITERVHNAKSLEDAQLASTILFGASSFETLKSLNKETFLDVFEAVPSIEISLSNFKSCTHITELLSVATQGKIFTSKGEARRMIDGGGVQINKCKINSPEEKSDLELLHNEYLIVQKGKKNYFIIKVIK